MEPKQIRLQYGPLAPSLEQQLNEQGFTLGDQRSFLERLHQALNLCGMHILSEQEYLSAKKRLHKKVMEHVKYIE